ncbi:MAG: Glucose 1-dehydrogenase, partial [uncultured Thermomicrobiales bacterium]
ERPCRPADRPGGDRGRRDDTGRRRLPRTAGQSPPDPGPAAVPRAGPGPGALAPRRGLRHRPRDRGRPLRPRPGGSARPRHRPRGAGRGRSGRRGSGGVRAGRPRHRHRPPPGRLPLLPGRAAGHVPLAPLHRARDRRRSRLPRRTLGRRRALPGAGPLGTGARRRLARAAQRRREGLAPGDLDPAPDHGLGTDDGGRLRGGADRPAPDPAAAGARPGRLDPRPVGAADRRRRDRRGRRRHLRLDAPDVPGRAGADPAEHRPDRRGDRCQPARRRGNDRARHQWRPGPARQHRRRPRPAGAGRRPRRGVRGRQQGACRQRQLRPRGLRARRGPARPLRGDLAGPRRADDHRSPAGPRGGSRARRRPVRREDGRRAGTV